MLIFSPANQRLTGLKLASSLTRTTFLVLLVHNEGLELRLEPFNERSGSSAISRIPTLPCNRKQTGLTGSCVCLAAKATVGQPVCQNFHRLFLYSGEERCGFSCRYLSFRRQGRGITQPSASFPWFPPPHNASPHSNTNCKVGTMKTNGSYTMESGM